MNSKTFLLTCIATMSPGCMTLHRTSIGDVARGGRKFEIQITDVGINLERTSKAIGEMADKSKEAEQIKSIMGLFQWGPKTGNPVYNISAWSGLAEKILENCPSGRVHSLVSNREYREFYYGSAEGVRVTGYCLGENK